METAKLTDNNVIVVGNSVRKFLLARDIN